MKKFLVVALIGLFLLTNVFAEEIIFSDISANHWAKKHVYNLVELGVTKGYPDGTYRGNKVMTRYEATVFLSKLAATLERKIEEMSISRGGGESAVSARLLNELKAELSALEAEVAVLKAGTPGTSEGWSVKGNLATRARLYNLAGDADVSKQALQKAALEITKNLPDGTKVSFMYDTDYMTFDGDQDFVTEKAFALVANFKTDILDYPVAVELSSGPGLYNDAVDDPVAAPEDKIKLSTKISGFDIEGEYIQRSASTTLLKGAVKTILPIDILGPTDISVGFLNYYEGVNPLNDSKDLQLYVELGSMPSEKIKVGGSVVLGELLETEKIGLGVQGELDDLWNTGTVIKGTVHKYGAEFFNPVLQGTLDEYAALEVNAYGKWVGVNTASSTGFIGTDISVAAIQTISDKLKVIGKLWMPFTGTATDVIFTRLGVTAIYGLSDTWVASIGYDYTTYGDGATAALKDTTVDYIDVKISLNF